MPFLEVRFYHFLQILLFKNMNLRLISCNIVLDWKFSLKDKKITFEKITSPHPPVHFTSWKFALYFVYIFIVNWDILTKFCSSDPGLNRNISTSLHIKSETSAHAQLRDYSFIHPIYKFHDMVSARNLHWEYILIIGVYG